MSVSQKQLEANRRNAKKSTGPKTKDGLAKSSKNAIKHGLYASDIVIKSPAFCEDPEEYEQLVRSLTDELGPVGQLQLYLVSKIANCVWRSMRVVRAETAHIKGRLDKVGDDVEAAERSKYYAQDLGEREEVSLTDEERERAMEKGIGERGIPEDRTSRYILYSEMRLDRQLVNAYQMLRQLQGRPKAKRKPKVESPILPDGWVNDDPTLVPLVELHRREKAGQGN